MKLKCMERKTFTVVLSSRVWFEDHEEIMGFRSLSTGFRNRRNFPYNGSVPVKTSRLWKGSPLRRFQNGVCILTSPSSVPVALVVQGILIHLSLFYFYFTKRENLHTQSQTALSCDSLYYFCE